MNEKQLKQLIEIKNYTIAVLENDQTGHNMDHINRVVSLAKKIQSKEGGNLFLILSGAYLHDVMDDKLVSNPEKARIDLEVFLKNMGLTKAECQHVFEIIDNVSFSHQLEVGDDIELSLEAQIVQDADRLDAVGAIGIGRTFYYGGKKGHEMHNPSFPPRENMTKEDYRINETVINHFYEKLLKLTGMMHTNTAKELGSQRHQLMLDFVEAFIDEWQV